MPANKVTNKQSLPLSGDKGKKEKVILERAKRPIGSKPGKDSIVSPLARLQNDKNKTAKPATPRTNVLSVPVYSLAGKAIGTLSLPKEVFGRKVSKELLAQVVRVYTTNQKNLTAKTKTRGEVEGSKAKIFRQKGTGHARHGAITAPIFVGGGIVFGPRTRNVRLELPKKMRKAALLAALSDKAQESVVSSISGLDKATGKTKEMASLTKNLKLKTALIVTGEKMDNVVRAAKNIPGVDVLPVNLINAYEVLRHQSLIITKEAIEKLTEGGKK